MIFSGRPQTEDAPQPRRARSIEEREAKELASQAEAEQATREHVAPLRAFHQNHERLKASGWRVRRAREPTSEKPTEHKHQAEDGTA
jgi:hypothetical protein